MDVALVEGMIKATEEVVKKYLECELKCKMPNDGEYKTTSHDLSVIIGYAGNISGAFILKMSNKMAAALGKKMLGIEIPEGSPDAKDASAEVFNMIVGIAKKNYSPETETFKITVPTIISGSDYSVYIKNQSQKNISLIDFICGDFQFNIEIYVE